MDTATHAIDGDITRNSRQDFEETIHHNHLPDPTRLEIRGIRNFMKESVANVIGANTTTTIVQMALMNASDAAKAALPITDHLKRNIQRQRNAANVPIPLLLSRDAIQLLLEFQWTEDVLRPSPFLLWDSGPAVANDERILMFVSQKNLDFMQTCSSILSDGTFKTAPLHFAQLYTIHGTRLVPAENKPSKALPLIFLLLPDKNEATYLRVFQKLVTLLPQWTPDRAMVDFEKAALNALHAQWPNLTVSGCFFLLNQNIWRKIPQLGLTGFYREDVENAIHLKMIAAIALVPPAEVIPSWNDLITILQGWMQQIEQNTRDAINDLLAYFEVNYIGLTQVGGRQPPRVAPIELWNMYQRTIDHYGRTDNEVEGFHLKVAHTMGVQHPNLWKFLKGLQGLQVETEKSIEEINSGLVIRKQRPQYLRLAERIRNVVLAWPTRQNLETYLRGISYTFQYGGD